MAKVIVVDKIEQTRIPFLRGILTRSLQEAGLDFARAYALSTAIRRELSGVSEITTAQLRQRVSRELNRIDPRLTRVYRSPNQLPVRPSIRDFEGRIRPFSEIIYRRSLEASGVGPEVSTTMARELLESLFLSRRRVIRSAVLGRFTYSWLRRSRGENVAQRYLVWVDHRRQGRPLLLLIGGTPGCGKSTIATELASRLEIPRIQSTDMLREVMRALLPESQVPVLHHSSFSAWRALASSSWRDHWDAGVLADGYRRQAEQVALISKAVIERAQYEQVSLILEGVHIEPGLYRHIALRGGTVVVPVTLAVFNPKRLGARFSRRSRQAVERRSECGENNFEAIWALQSYLLDEADRHNVAIVNNKDKEQALQECMAIIVETLAADFNKSPQQVFAESRSNT